MKSGARWAAMFGGLLCASAVALAQNETRVQVSRDPKDAPKAPGEVQKTLNSAKVSLPDAVRNAERATQGKASCAEIMEWRCLESKANISSTHEGAKGKHQLTAESPIARVVCVTNDRVVEALVCLTTGDVIDKREGGQYSRGSSFYLDGAGSQYASGHSSYEEVWFRAPSRWQKASDIIGKPVVAAGSADHIGDVKELVVDPDGGRILYTVVEFHGKMGHGNRWFAIPIQATKLTEDYKSVVLDYTTSKMNEANGFDRNAWPNITDEKWAGGIHTAYGQQPFWKDDDKGAGARDKTDGRKDETATRDRDGNWRQAPRRWQKASDLMGKEVRNPQNDVLGAVKEIVIDADSGRILYGVLSFGGFLGVGDKYFAIPWGSLELAQDYKTIVLAVEKDRLKNAEGFDKSKWPNLADTRWAATVYDYYGRPRYWER